MAPVLPTNGQTNWGTPLNNYITEVVLAQANLAETTISTHQSASDPHGDRAYSLSLVTPITSLVNQPNGYVVLNSSGQVPNSLLPSAGGLSDVYDVSSSTFGGVGTPGVDDTNAIQNALNACAAAGGGEVWIPNGTWTISSTLVIGNNTWLHLSPGATIIRGINVGTGLRPTVMLANFNSTTALTNITGNIIVSGGTWDATNGHTVTSTMSSIMEFANAQFVEVSETQFINLPYTVCIWLFGTQAVLIETNKFISYTPTSATSSFGAVRISLSSSADMPAGLNGTMYANRACTGVIIDKCIIPTPIGGLGTGSLGSYYTLLSCHTTPSPAHSQIVITNCSVTDTFAGSPFFHIPAASALTLVNVSDNVFIGANNIQSSFGIVGTGGNGLFNTMQWSGNLGSGLDVEQFNNMTLVNNFLNQGGSDVVAQVRVILKDRIVEIVGIILVHTVVSRAFCNLPYTFGTVQFFDVWTTNAAAYGQYYGQVLQSGQLQIVGNGVVAATYGFFGRLSIDA